MHQKERKEQGRMIQLKGIVVIDDKIILVVKDFRSQELLNDFHEFLSPTIESERSRRDAKRHNVVAEEGTIIGKSQ